jgi:hypothetical protein
LIILLNGCKLLLCDVNLNEGEGLDGA